MKNNIRYTYIGPIDPKLTADMLMWINEKMLSELVTGLTIYLSSLGGDIDSAIRTYRFLKGLPFEVEVIGFGQIDSAANLIYLGASKRIALVNTRFLLHEGSFTIGQPTAALHVHEETLTTLKKLLLDTVDIISTGSGKTKEEISEILKVGKILTTTEAKEFGLVHDIIEKLPAFEIPKK